MKAALYSRLCYGLEMERWSKFGTSIIFRMYTKGEGINEVQRGRGGLHGKTPLCPSSV